MRINADYTQRVVERPATAQWRPSPSPGVERRMLDRVGDEVAVATSIVRYAPNSRFPVHMHDKGEEFLVLEGVFSDDSGNYAAGTYVRNPTGTSHAPWTDEGTTILVKLRQFDDADLKQFAIDTTTAQWSEGPVAGSASLPLHSFGTEQVQMLRLDSAASFPAREVPQGEEIYVVSGEIRDSHERYAAGTWIRNPAGEAPGFEASAPTVLWMKSGHLHPDYGPAR